MKDLRALDAQLEALENKRSEIQENLSGAEGNYMDEVSGKNSAAAGVGKRANALKGIVDKYQRELEQFDKRNNDKIILYESQRKRLAEELDSELAKNQIVAAGLDGLLARINLAHELAGFWISLFITLLFMAIELTPIFFKMMLTKGPYNYMKENVRELLLADQGIELEYDYYKDKKGQERIKIHHHQALKLIHEKREILIAQKKLNENIIDKWVQREIDNLDDNLENYITSTKPN